MGWIKRSAACLAAMVAVVLIAVVAAALGGTANLGSSAAPTPVRGPAAAAEEDPTGLRGGGEAGRARGDDTFAAIAYNKVEGFYGYGYRFGTRTGAQNAALNECEIRSVDPTRCRIRVWVKNGCASVGRVISGGVVSSVPWGFAGSCNNAQKRVLSEALGPARIVTAVHSNSGEVP